VNSFEFNKIAAAVLIALLVAMVASLIGDALVSPSKLEKNSYIVDVSAVSTSSDLSENEKPLAPIGPLLIKADVANGEKIFKKCVSCHSIEKSAPHKIGPNLWGIVMNKIAHAVDYAYSAAIKDKDGHWDYENLNKFLHKPREFAPGTKMTFIGLATDQERADLVAFLRKKADNPAPLPG
jgi:cytochrome c